MQHYLPLIPVLFPHADLNPTAAVYLAGKGADVELHLFGGEVWHVVRMDKTVEKFAGIALRQEERLERHAIGRNMRNI